MIDNESPASPAPKKGGQFTIWLNALAFVGFIGVMLLTVEGTLAWVIGSFAHSPSLGFIVLAAAGLPTLYWLCLPCLRGAVSAERDIFRAPPGT